MKTISLNFSIGIHSDQYLPDLLPGAIVTKKTGGKVVTITKTIFLQEHGTD